jgi:hypothetical protein
MPKTEIPSCQAQRITTVPAAGVVAYATVPGTAKYYLIQASSGFNRKVRILILKTYFSSLVPFTTYRRLQISSGDYPQ